MNRLYKLDRQPFGPDIMTTLEVPLSCTDEGFAPYDVWESLIALTSENPWVRVKTFWRSPGAQRDFRSKYIAWVSAGKPEPSSAAFDGWSMSTTLVAEPGRSMHNAGRGINFDIGSMEQELGIRFDQRFISIAKRHGFTPSNSDILTLVSLDWHFDHWGPWAGVMNRSGRETAALCACLAVGKAAQWQSDVAVVQAHLHRLEAYTDEVDGRFGSRTRDSLAMVLKSSGYRQDVLDEVAAAKDDRSAELPVIIELLESM